MTVVDDVLKPVQIAAQAPAELKNRISHRGRALAQLREKLLSHG